MPTSSNSLDPEKAERKPRYGYLSLATWLAQDPDNESFVFRKFDRLSAQNLLNLQSQLISLESRIDTLNEKMKNSSDPDLLVSLARWETYDERAKIPGNLEHEKMVLEKELKRRIKEYHEALLLQSNISRLDRPTSRLLNIYRSFFNNPEPIIYGSAGRMLDDEQDLVALRPPLESDPLSRILRDHWPFRGKSYPDNTFQYFPESQVKWAVIVITTMASAVLLMGAIAGLYFVKRPEAKLGMIAGLTTLFAASVGGLTSAKRQEVFAASAAYAAVLVVFVSGDFDKDN